MPKNTQGQVLCLNGTNNPQHQMITSDNLSSLTKVEKNENGGIDFILDSGIPVQAFVCIACGYTELYYDKSIAQSVGDKK